MRSNSIPARSAGILIPLFALRTRDDLGRGEIGGLVPFGELAAEMRHRLIQMLPIGETAPGELSPYSALSAFAIDPLYISLEPLDGLSSRDRAGARTALGSDSRTVAPERLRAVKLPLLQRAHEFFERRGGVQRDAFLRFVETQRGWLDDYALFRALKDKFGWAAWEQWPDALKERDSAALETARTELAEPIERYRYWQFLANRQWDEARRRLARLGVLLGGDLAFSPGRDSADVWANRRIFSLARLVGAPPDAFSEDGQRWGLPMPQWERMRAEGFRWWRMRARRSHALFDLLRIDHVVGFYRTYSFGLDPDARGEFFPADENAQLEQGETFLRMLIEEIGARGLIAEDLGAIPPWVRQSLTRLGLSGLKVVRWEKQNWGAPDERFISPRLYPELSVATTGTHDTETFAQWWGTAADHERRQLAEALDLGGRLELSRRSLDIETLNMIIEGVYGAASRLVITPIQDLFGWRERVNTPGTVGESNWTYRLPHRIEQMRADPVLRAQIAAIGDIVKRSGRDG